MATHKTCGITATRADSLAAGSGPASACAAPRIPLSDERNNLSQRHLAIATWNPDVFKLLGMLVTFLLVGLGLLGLRQHRLELTAQSTRIYDAVRDREHTLLDQRVEIARHTNPWAVAAALEQQGVNTGEALRPRQSRGRPPGAVNVPAVETDLVAPLLNQNRGH